MTRVIHVQVSDEVAEQMIEEMKARGEWPWAACVEVLLRDRQRRTEALQAIVDLADSRDVYEIAKRGLES